MQIMNIFERGRREGHRCNGAGGAPSAPRAGGVYRAKRASGGVRRKDRAAWCVCAERQRAAASASARRRPSPPLEQHRIHSSDMPPPDRSWWRFLLTRGSDGAWVRFAGMTKALFDELVLLAPRAVSAANAHCTGTARAPRRARAPRGQGLNCMHSCKRATFSKYVACPPAPLLHYLSALAACFYAGFRDGPLSLRCKAFALTT